MIVVDYYEKIVIENMASLPIVIGIRSQAPCQARFGPSSARNPGNRTQMIPLKIQPRAKTHFEQQQK